MPYLQATPECHQDRCHPDITPRDVAAISPRYHPNITPISPRYHPDITPISLRAMSPRRHPDITPRDVTPISPRAMSPRYHYARCHPDITTRDVADVLRIGCDPERVMRTSPLDAQSKDDIFNQCQRPFQTFTLTFATPGSSG